MKKGFTLIELLAVLAVLSILVVIATPIITDVISDAEESANKDSIKLYAKEVARAYLDDNYGSNPSDFNNSSDGGTTTNDIITFSNEWISEKLELSNNNVDCNGSDILSKVKFDKVSKEVILEECKVGGSGNYSYYSGEVIYQES